MRLKKLKLSGFKSFVDPTTVAFPGQLVCIVGPNGCGKSNTIDAVRWVMGESSAKHLRGESITDVIFNGSSGRKPVGQATVELIFDNSDQTVIGEYAQYAEISVKRTVTREGISTYYLNGNRCRRRDIIDIILGTGVGPRSYAIIEQGMISRLIEAKPEELRSHLEEVAGIAKYKERRRETENRIKHTRENLERLNDLCDELNKQLEHLHKQAKTAERYKQLKADELTWQDQLNAIRWRDLEQAITAQQLNLSKHQSELDKYLSEQRHTEAMLERYREELHEFNESLQDAQSTFYRQGAKVTQLEQTIENHRKRQEQLAADSNQTKQAIEMVTRQFDNDKRDFDKVISDYDEVAPSLDAMLEEDIIAQETLHETEASVESWQERWQNFQEAAAKQSKLAEIEQVKIQHIEQTTSQLKQRLERVVQEMATDAVDSLEGESECLHAELLGYEERTTALDAQLDDIRGSIVTKREEIEDADKHLSALRTQLEEERGRYASLKALQEAALDDGDENIQAWLRDHQLADAPKISDVIEVAAGYEEAVEAVLGDALKAVCLASLDALQTCVQELDEGNMAFWEVQTSASASETSTALQPLSQFIQWQKDVSNCLSHVFFVETLEDALKVRHQCQPHELIVTRDGLCVGATHLLVAKGSAQQKGVLARKKALAQSHERIELMQSEVASQQEQLQAQKLQLHSIEQERDEHHAQSQSLRHNAAEVKAAAAKVDAKLESARLRQEKLAQDESTLSEDIEDKLAELNEARSLLQVALDDMAAHEQARHALLQEKETYQLAHAQARETARRVKDDVMQLKMQAKTLSMQKDALEKQLSRNADLREQHQSRLEQLTEQLHENDSPVTELKSDLDKALHDMTSIEKDLVTKKERVSTHGEEIQKFEAARLSKESHVQERRTQLENTRLAHQSLLVKQTTISESFENEYKVLTEIIAQLPEAANAELWNEELARIQKRIVQLGAINLAAIEEYETQSERKNYLDSQQEDLMDALETLEQAIHKIDKETKARFKETFDFVNSSLREMFPRMFGGGEAYLELTGEDLLSTGVSIIARPPGKRNANIHLLSGGEKALTAIALVFSLFKLNPAPFCMLDEVDAPLDDTNVGRFAKLVAEMSSSVQFVFITHNKITMEMAEYLMGVTMKEPGVSRIVSVDMDEATQMIDE